MASLFGDLRNIENTHTFWYAGACRCLPKGMHHGRASLVSDINRYPIKIRRGVGQRLTLFSLVNVSRDRTTCKLELYSPF